MNRLGKHAQAIFDMELKCFKIVKHFLEISEFAKDWVFGVGK
jgi:hypothetical protein